MYQPGTSPGQNRRRKVYRSHYNVFTTSNKFDENCLDNDTKPLLPSSKKESQIGSAFLCVRFEEERYEDIFFPSNLILVVITDRWGWMQ